MCGLSVHGGFPSGYSKRINASRRTTPHAKHTHGTRTNKMTGSHASKSPLAFDQHPLEASTIREASKALMLGTTVGAVSGSIFAWWIRAGWAEAPRIIGRRAGIWGGMGALGYGGAVALAKARHVEDSWNAAFGGALAGALSGLMRRWMCA
jgi:hypothetical protein